MYKPKGIVKHFQKVLYTQEQIEAKCKELANWINKQYKGANDLIIVPILRGAFPFLTKLIKDITVSHRIDFIAVSSYYGRTTSSNQLKFLLDLNINIHNQQVLVVDGIVDTGLTIATVVGKLKQQNPKSIKTLVLFDKKAARKNNFEVDKYGFVAPNKYLTGFGLDFKEEFRYIPFVGILTKAKLDAL